MLKFCPLSPRHDNSAAVWVCGVSATCPSNTVAALEVVRLRPKGVELAGKDQARKFTPASRWFWMRTTDTVKIAKEDARMSTLAEKQ
jgi:hypothetical protein